MKVKIPFYERFKEPLLNDTKTWTCRTRWMGNVGDIFSAFGHDFEIVKRERRTLRDVADNHFREEGCISTRDFVELWNKIHPRKGFVPSQRGYVHIFRRIS